MANLNLRKITYRWRVRAGSTGLILAILLSRPTFYSLLLGIGICMLGLLIRTWASGHIRKEKELTTSGPYLYTRNPLYLGNLVIGISVVLGSRSWGTLFIFAAYFLLFYPGVIKREKEKMKKLFPREYKDYKKKVPLFFPSLKASSSSKKNKFSLATYRKNKEYRALAGAVLFWLIMASKMIFF